MSTGLQYGPYLYCAYCLLKISKGEGLVLGYPYVTDEDMCVETGQARSDRSINH